MPCALSLHSPPHDHDRIFGGGGFVQSLRSSDDTTNCWTRISECRLMYTTLGCLSFFGSMQFNPLDEPHACMFTQRFHKVVPRPNNGRGTVPGCETDEVTRCRSNGVWLLTWCTLSRAQTSIGSLTMLTGHLIQSGIIPWHHASS